MWWLHVLVLVFAGTASYANGEPNATLIISFYEGRIYRNASAGQNVTLNRNLREYVQQFTSCYLHVVEWDVTSGDHQLFRWNHSSFSLVTTAPVERDLGDYYLFGMVPLCVDGQGEPVKVMVRVSDENVHSPRFVHDRFRFRVPVGADPGYAIGAVRASDEDIVIYNSQLEYEILRIDADVPMNVNTYVNMDINIRKNVGAFEDLHDAVHMDDGGVLWLNRHAAKLWKSTKRGSVSNVVSTQQKAVVTLAVQACDYGSPRKCATADVELVLVELTEPTAATVLAAIERYQIICWRHPAFGNVSAYRISFIEVNGLGRLMNMTTGKGLNMETYPRKGLIMDTTPRTGVSIEIYPWKSPIMGTYPEKGVNMDMAPKGGSTMDPAPGSGTIDQTVMADYSQSKQCAVTRLRLVLGREYSLTIHASSSGDSSSSRPVSFITEREASCNGTCQNKGVPMCVPNNLKTGGSLRQFVWASKKYCVCSKAFYGESCEFTAFCESLLTDTNHGTFSWPRTNVYATAQNYCPYGPKLTALTRRCVYDNVIAQPKWEEFTVAAGQCRSKAMIDKELDTCLNNSGNFTLESLMRTASVLEQNLAAAVEDRNIGEKVLHVLDKVLAANLNSLSVSTRQSLGQRFVQLVEDFADHVIVNRSSGMFSVDSDLITVIVQQLAELDLNSSAVAWQLRNETAVEFPPLLLKQGRKAVADSRIKTVLFQRRTFYVTGDGGTLNGDEIESPVVKIGFKDMQPHWTQRLPSPIVFRMKGKQAGSYHCVFWNQNTQKWDEAGLTTLSNGSVDGEVICESTHLTGFSILLDVGSGERIDSGSHHLLNILSWIGCGLSIIGLASTILTFSLFRFLRRDYAGTILVNLSLAMLLMNLFFIVSSLKPFVNLNQSACAGVGALLHFFTLSTFLWMGIEAANMYDMLVNVFVTREKFFMLKRCLIGWVLPALVTVAALAVNPDFYFTDNDIEDRYCQISKSYPHVFYGAYVVPVCVILLLNAIIFTLLLRVLLQSATKKLGHSAANQKPISLAVQIRGAFTVLVLLGITWTLGCFAISRLRLPLMYVFCVLNSLQGFIIFVVRCLMHAEARAAWLVLLRTGKLRRPRARKSVTISTSESNSYRPLARQNSNLNSNHVTRSLTNESSVSCGCCCAGGCPNCSGTGKKQSNCALIGRSDRHVLIVENPQIGECQDAIGPDMDIVKVKKQKDVVTTSTSTVEASNVVKHISSPTMRQLYKVKQPQQPGTPTKAKV